MDDLKLLTYTLEKLKDNFATANVPRILDEESYDVNFAKKICRRMFEICENNLGLYDKAIQDFIDLSIEFIVLQSELERTRKYKYNNFEEVEKFILENKNIMPGRYLNGLLLSQAFWLNHYKIFKFFGENFCKSNNQGTVLEVPIGTGIFLSEFMQKNKEWQFKGCDLSTFSVNFATKYISLNNDKNAEISKKNLFDIEENSKYDKIICGELMEHLDDPKRLLLKLKNLLKQEGEIFLTTVVWLAHIDHIYLFKSVDEIRKMVEPFFDIKEELILPLEQAKVSDIMPINYAVILKHKKQCKDKIENKYKVDKITFSDYLNRSKTIQKDNSMPELKVAFLSNFTINGLSEVLKVKSHQEFIWIEAYNAPYNQYIQEIINPASGLYKKEQDLIFLLLDAEAFLGDFFYFPYRYSSEQRKEFITEKIKDIENLLNLLQERTKAKIVINEFLIPSYSSRGIIESKQEWGLTESIYRINESLRNICKNNNRLFAFPLNSFCAHHLPNPLAEPKIVYLTDMKISSDGLIGLASEYMSYIYPLASKNKKCLVLDLDNTLWGGVIGEDGSEGIKLGLDKEGRVFLDFQRSILELFERGVILAVNSKNNYEDAMEVIRNHKYMLLKEDHFACIKINWQDKATNLRQISAELDIGLDSLVFLDDDKANRALIRELIPEVTVIDLPEDVSLYSSTIKSLKHFNLFHLTDEDLKRGKMYVDQKKRSLLESEITDLNTFIKQLQIKVMIKQVDDSIIGRVTQLTQKTNQFNLTTKRYKEEEMQELSKSADYQIESITVEDKFGEYGLTGAAIIKKDLEDKCWHLDTFLLSCRVLGKNVEFALMNHIIKKAKTEGVKMIKGYFIPTKKNKPAENFLKDCGFNLSKEDEKIKEYIFDLNNEFKTEILVDVQEWKN